LTLITNCHALGFSKDFYRQLPSHHFTSARLHFAQSHVFALLNVRSFKPSSTYTFYLLPQLLSSLLQPSSLASLFIRTLTSRSERDIQQSGSNIFNGFDQEFLEDYFNIENELARKLQSRDDRSQTSFTGRVG